MGEGEKKSCSIYGNGLLHWWHKRWTRSVLHSSVIWLQSFQIRFYLAIHSNGLGGLTWRARRWFNVCICPFDLFLDVSKSREPLCINLIWCSPERWSRNVATPSAGVISSHCIPFLCLPGAGSLCRGWQNFIHYSLGSEPWRKESLETKRDVGLSQIRYEAEIKGKSGSSWQKMRQEKVKWGQRGMNKNQTSSENSKILQGKSNI